MAGGGSFLAGALIVLFVILANVIGAYVNTQVIEPFTVPGCQSQNASECQDVGQESFAESVSQTTVNGIEGAPDFVNDLWLLISVFMLIVGIFMVILGIIGLVFGG